MVNSQGWKWEIVPEDKENIWKNPCIESYYLLNRWSAQGKTIFFDLGCGLGRHSILFAKNGFQVFSSDISENAIMKTKKWAEDEGLKIDTKVCDMLSLPYKDEQFDCIICRNVINHTDTVGIKKAISEIYRVLKKDGECYLTLVSKDSWGYKQPDWPKIDENTTLKMEEGPEYKVPHFYADYDLIMKLFNRFSIENIYQVIDYHKDSKTNQVYESYHYHVLIKKILS